MFEEKNSRVSDIGMLRVGVDVLREHVDAHFINTARAEATFEEGRAQLAEARRLLKEAVGRIRGASTLFIGAADIVAESHGEQLEAAENTAQAIGLEQMNQEAAHELLSALGCLTTASIDLQAQYTTHSTQLHQREELPAPEQFALNAAYLIGNQLETDDHQVSADSVKLFAGQAIAAAENISL